MPTPSAISPLDLFAKAFPYLQWLTHSSELCYPFLGRPWVESAAGKARRLIIEKGLPLVVSCEERPFGKSLRNVLIIKPAPEEYTFADEVADDEHYIEERAAWPE